MPAALKDISNAEFDPFFDERLAFGDVREPWAFMARMRSESPVSEGGYEECFGGAPDPSTAHLKHYTAWSYDAVDAVFADPKAFNSTGAAHSGSIEPAFGRILLVMDPPEHTKYRRILQNLFSPKNTKLWIDTIIRPVVDELIDGFAHDGRAELVSQFTQRYPFEVTYRLLDLPEADMPLFHKLSVTQVFGQTAFAAEAIEAGHNLGEYLRELIAERRQEPGTDFVSALIESESDGERLDDEFVVAFLRHILNASADTSSRTTGSLLVGLLLNPAQMQEVAGDTSLIPLAIDETLRWNGPVVTNIRTVTNDIELAGVQLDAGSVIHVVQGSANRDESRFEHPDDFDLTRRRRHRHFGFGGGIHTCAGMYFARTQIREAMTQLLDRLPGLRPDPLEPSPYVRGFQMRTPDQVSVIFDS